MAGAEASMGRFEKAAGKGQLSLGRLGNQFGNLIASMTGVPPVMTNVLSVLGNFAIGSSIMVGALAGLALLAVAYTKITEGARTAKKETDDLIKSLVEQSKQARLATVEGQQALAVSLVGAQWDAENKLMKLRRLSRLQLGDVGGVHARRIRDAEADLTSVLEAQGQTRINLAAIEAAALSKTADIRKTALAEADTALNKMLSRAQDKAAEFWRSFGVSATPAIDRISERLEGMFDLAKVPKVREREGFGSWLTNQVGEFTPEQINPWAKSTAEIPPKLETLGDRLKEGLGDVGTMLINGLAGVANAMLLGGKGRGSQIGGGLGGAAGGALGGMMLGGKLGAFGGPIGMAVGSVIGTLGGSLFGGLFDKKKKVAKGLDLMAAGLNRVNEALRNTPSGYRVRLATFEATKPPPPPPLPEGPRAGPEGPGGTGGGRPGGGAPTFYIAELSVLANDATSLVREIGRAAQQEAARGGTSRLALAVGG